MAAFGLQAAWAQRHAWTVLDTDFQDGQHFLSIWRAWQRDPQRPKLLHYVGIAQAAPDIQRPVDALGADGPSPVGLHALASQFSGLDTGFHRILLDGAKVSLTLCLGEVPAMLGEHVFQTDTLIARPPVDKWEVQALARRCKRGTGFWIPAKPELGTNPDLELDLPALLRSAGFQLDALPAESASLTGRFDPRWEIPTGRTANKPMRPTPARCAVVGAGLAGASVAHALAVRGWQVTVFDRHALPAGGASGLPVGLAVPHVSLDDSPRSRMSRGGTHLLRQHADRMLQRGQDWDPSGVLERLPDGSDRWHAKACWIKPAHLVRAWLAQADIAFAGSTSVAKLSRVEGLWQLKDQQGLDLGSFEMVVIANAMACADLLTSQNTAMALGTDLLDKLAALQAVHGTLSRGHYAQPVAGLPATPVNGNGCFIPHVADADGVQWFAGSTFEVDAALAADGPAQHAANMDRLQQLLAMPNFPLIEALNRAPVSLWTSTRCVTHDRLPLVGPVETSYGPGLWMCVGMGARGLSFSALCAELLVARMGAEPLPLAFSLSRSLDVNRVRRRQAATPKR